jgi:hypothetical protein
VVPGEIASFAERKLKPEQSIMQKMDLSKPERYRENAGHYIIFSVDLGKMQDFTAWTIVELKPEGRTTYRGKRIVVRTLTVRDIVRLELGTTYDKIHDLIHGQFWDPRLWLIDRELGRPIPPQLLIDAGGVGDSTVDTLAANLDLRENITSYKLVRGTSKTQYHSKNKFTVPRTVMFQMLDAAFHNNQITIDPRLTLAPALANELKNLKTEGNEETGYIKVVHREGEHDDLSICLGAANFLAQVHRKKRPPPVKFMDSSGTTELDPATGLPKGRKGQELRKHQLEKRARDLGIGVGGPGLKTNLGKWK